MPHPVPSRCALSATKLVRGTPGSAVGTPGRPWGPLVGCRTHCDGRDRDWRHHGRQEPRQPRCGLQFLSSGRLLSGRARGASTCTVHRSRPAASRRVLCRRSRTVWPQYRQFFRDEVGGPQGSAADRRQFPVDGDQLCGHLGVGGFAVAADAPRGMEREARRKEGPHPGQQPSHVVEPAQLHAQPSGRGWQRYPRVDTRFRTHS